MCLSKDMKRPTWVEGARCKNRESEEGRFPAARRMGLVAHQVTLVSDGDAHLVVEIAQHSTLTINALQRGGSE